MKSPSTEDYVRALEKAALSAHERRFLQALYSFPRHSATATEVASALGYKGFPRSNIDIGKIGRKLGEVLQISPSVWRSGRKQWWSIVAEGEGGGPSFVWLMRTQLAAAMEQVSLAEGAEKSQRPRRAEVTRVNYWVCKGRPARNDFRKYLVPGRIDQWNTRRRPGLLAAGDRVFFWESSPALRLVGLGVITNANLGKGEDGDDLFELRYLTTYFADAPGIEELRQMPIVREAAFLKSGPATTLTRLLPEQAEVLFQFLCARNPGLSLGKVWAGLQQEDPQSATPLEVLAREGGRKLFAHYVRERNPRIVAEKRKAVLEAKGRLACEVCGFDFESTYGLWGHGFCEVHHRLPLSQAEGEVETRLEDLAVVCSNCHRVIHRCEPPRSMEELRRQLRRVLNDSGTPPPMRAGQPDAV